MPKMIDYTGQKFGMLTVLEMSHRHNNSIFWKTKCDCGGEKIISSSCLREGKGLHCADHPRVGLGRTRKILGKKFGRLTVIAYVGNENKTGSVWTVHCDCGTIKNLRGSDFASPSSGTLSCGCLIKERRIESHTTHGETKNGEWSPRYYLWSNAKARSAKKGLIFNLDLDDIVIPKTCPLLGIPLFPGDKETGPIRNSPTLDRIYPDRGYVKGNVWVISYKANSMKNDASPEEIKRLSENLERKINELNRNPRPNEPSLETSGATAVL